MRSSIFTVFLLLVAALPPAFPQPYYSITSIAGTNEVGDSGPALDAQLAAVEGLAIDAAGNLYIADNTDHRIRKVDTLGVITTIAGDGNPGFSGDGGPAIKARLKNPYGIAVDAFNNIYIADYGNSRIRRITPDGKIQSVATSLLLSTPRNIAVDSVGNLYVSDHTAHRVVRITQAGQTDIVAANLSYPAGLAIDAQGSLYIADTGNKLVRRLTNGILTTVAGNPGSLQLYGPTGLTLDTAGNLFITDSLISRVICRAPDGKFTVIAGVSPPLTGPTRDIASFSGALYIADGKRVLKLANATATPVAFAGGGAAISSYLAGPMGIALAPNGDLYIAEERTAAIRRLNPSGFIESIIAGGSPNGNGDGGPAIHANLTDPVALAIHPELGVRIADYAGNRIRGIGFNQTSTAMTVAGTGYAGFSGAEINHPRGMSFDTQGNLYFADTGNHRIRVLGRDGFIRTLAPAIVFKSPQGVAAGTTGDIYVADSGNNLIRKIDANGITTTLTGLPELHTPAAVAVDSQGNLFIADTFNHRILRRDASGTTQIIAGTGLPGFSGDGGPATLAELRSPSSLAIDPNGSIYIADLDNNRIRKLTPTAEPLIITSTLTVLNAASLTEDPIAPGQLISIFGGDFGDNPTVRIDNIAAPIFYASKQQINAQVPPEVSGKQQARIEVFSSGELKASALIPVLESSPAFFTLSQGQGEVIAVHLDGSINTPDNPAPRGSIVTLYATGAGIDQTQPVSVIIGTGEAELLYSGPAPALIGVMQINLRLPGIYTPPGPRPIRLKIGSNLSRSGVIITLR